MKKLSALIILAIIGVFAFNLSTYTIREDEVAVVKTLGKIVAVGVPPSDAEKVKQDLMNQGYDVDVITTKGLHFKIPFIQTVDTYTAKYLTYTSTPDTINTFDRRKIDIQMYAQYRIMNPALYNMTVGTQSKLNNLMDDQVYPVVIQAANMLQFDEFFDKEKVMNTITLNKDTLNEEMLTKTYGIFVTDIGIHRKNFPQANITSIEEKMSMEIQKESQKLMAEGDSEYQKNLSETDRIKKEMVAAAIEEAATIKAQADAESLNIYQKSLQKDLEFYQFMQRMETYKNIKNTTVFLDQDNDFLKYLNGYGR